MTTAPELRGRLADVEDPLNGDDVVSMGLVNDVTVSEDTARVSLAFNAPYSPAEIEIGNDIRDVVENMSAYHCPNCEDVHDVFGSGGAAEISDDYDVPVLAELPVHPDFDSERGGLTIRDNDSAVQANLFEFVDATADRVGEINRRKVAEHREDHADEVPEEADAPAGSP